MFKIKELLIWAERNLKENNEILNPQLDSEYLLEEILKKDKTYIYSNPEKKVNFWQFLKFRSFIKKRKKLYPLAYLTKHKEFYNIDLEINNKIFIPRPETEILIETVLNYIENKNQKISIAEIGGGSGAIGISLLENTKLIKNYYISDISKYARNIIKKNAEKYNIGNKLKILDKANLSPFLSFPIVDILISNPPYVPYEKYKKSKTITYEPSNAITDYKDGTVFYEKLFKDLLENKYFPNYIILEIDEDTALAIKKKFEILKSIYSFDILKDLQNLDRFIILEKKEQVKILAVTNI